MPGSWKRQDCLLSPIVPLSFSCCHWTLDGHTWMHSNSSRLGPCAVPCQCINTNSFTSYSGVQSFFPKPWLSLGAPAATSTTHISTFPAKTYKVGVPVQCHLVFHHTTFDLLLCCLLLPKDSPTRRLCRQGQQFARSRAKGNLFTKIRKLSAQALWHKTFSFPYSLFLGVLLVLFN